MTDGKSLVDLSYSSVGDYSPGRSRLVRALWICVEAAILLNPLFTPYGPKRQVLRLFGARLGRRVVIKPGVHIKHPWRLKVGANSWLGERVWIDNLVDVSIGANVCISQGAYLCTGNHNWSDASMPLIASPITIRDGAWIGAFARVGPGVEIAPDSVVTLGSVVVRSTDKGLIYGGNPATPVRVRNIGTDVGAISDRAPR